MDRSQNEEFYRGFHPGPVLSPVERWIVDVKLDFITGRVPQIYGLRTPDAIHGATAIITQASGILTNNKRLKVLEKEGLAIWRFDTLV